MHILKSKDIIQTNINKYLYRKLGINTCSLRYVFTTYVLRKDIYLGEVNSIKVSLIFLKPWKLNHDPQQKLFKTINYSIGKSRFIPLCIDCGQIPIELKRVRGFPRGNHLRIAVNSCEHVFLASGFSALGRVLIPSSAELSGLHLTPEPLICFKPLARILGATQGLPNPHQYGFTEVLKVLGV